MLFLNYLRGSSMQHSNRLLVMALATGAVLVGGLQEYLRVTISSAVNVLVAGVLMVAFVIAAPQGIVGLFQRKR